MHLRLIILYFLVSLIGQFQSVGQTDDNPVNNECGFEFDSQTGLNVTKTPTIEPSLADGKFELYNLLKESYKVPRYVRIAGIGDLQFTIGFVIDEKGNVLGQRIIKQNIDNIEENQIFEALETLDWIPGTCNNEPVSTLMILPIHIKLF
ncbi:hypothetical protein OO013_20115 [Mangrovivirga sp. M17]|uniref:TonB C-terminal domain-containing protein n=1 Tax=Mangrovivirga halotolerans TaxID=2993936 RepID=A0ABT3RWZ3_9BACT|nr:hypothetical protein [Mangrovivirga halotolerans]MCX2746191.1 hypothetical protein [Mangrovivirga halotolerans]